jgi:hypothetical protein
MPNINHFIQLPTAPARLKFAKSNINAHASATRMTISSLSGLATTLPRFEDEPVVRFADVLLAALPVVVFLAVVRFLGLLLLAVFELPLVAKVVTPSIFFAEQLYLCNAA